jgi:hypothetical protein
MHKNRICPRCGKPFTHRGNLNAHLKIKKSCYPKYVDIPGNTIINNYQQYYNEYINKINNQTKPLKLSLIPKDKSKQNKLTLRNEIDDNKLESIKHELTKILKNDNNVYDVKNMINQLFSNDTSNNITTNDNKNIINDMNTSNNSGGHNTSFVAKDNAKLLNQQIYITVNGFGNEDLSHISKKDWNDIIRHNNNAIPQLTKKIHIDEPKNHNILINSLKNGYGYKYDGNNLIVLPIQEIAEDLVSLNADRLYDYMETHDTSRYKQQKISKVMDRLGEENSPLVKDNVKDIKYMFYNAKSNIKSTLDNID